MSQLIQTKMDSAIFRKGYSKDSIESGLFNKGNKYVGLTFFSNTAFYIVLLSLGEPN